MLIVASLNTKTPSNKVNCSHYLMNLLSVSAISHVYARLLNTKIRVTGDFQPKRMRPYRVPEGMKAEVDRQIKELLDVGHIVLSDSPMASPLVCVAKKQGDARLACDYRYVNSFTVGDVFPLCSVDEMIRKVGRGRYISLFDVKSGYWQFFVRPEDRWLKAFVTYERLYEWVRMQ